MGEGTLDGGKGNDLIEFTTDGYAGKAAYGGDGNDTIRYAATQGEEIGPEMIIDLWGGAGTDKLYAGAAQDLLHFTPANSPAGKAAISSSALTATPTGCCWKVTPTGARAASRTMPSSARQRR